MLKNQFLSAILWNVEKYFYAKEKKLECIYEKHTYNLYY